MEQIEDLERVTAFAEQLGLPFDQIVNYWKTNGKLTLGTFVESVSLKKFAKDEFPKVRVGWYAFEGGKFSPTPYAYPNCQGVVAWLNPDPNAPKGKQGLILTPDKEKLKWADKYCKTGIDSKEDGKSNTKRLIVYGNKHGIDFPAAEWCYSYSKNGVKSGEGFLPATYQLQQIVANRDVINFALNKIGGTVFIGWIWSSSEYSGQGAWLVDASNGKVNTYIKNYDYFSVRCFLAF